MIERNYYIYFLFPLIGEVLFNEKNLRKAALNILMTYIKLESESLFCNNIIQILFHEATYFDISFSMLKNC